MNSSEKVEFWNHKILTWEESRYSSKKTAAPALLKRISFAADFIMKNAKQKSVLDVGCGSGLLFSHLDPTQFKKLVGVDFSNVAIENAQAKFKSFQNVEFVCGTVRDLNVHNADCVVALGLTDWLEAADLDLLLEQVKDKTFLISFSDKDQRVGRLLHQFFVWCTYGWRRPSYIPKYYSGSELQALMTKKGTKNCVVLRGQGLDIVSYLVKS